MSFKGHYTGHLINARKALVKLGLATEKELAYLADGDVEDRINKSDYVVIKSGDDYGIMTKELAEQITWVCR